MKIWSSKYALTDGIKETEARQVSESMVEVGPGYYLHGDGKEWHRTRGEAVNRAEEMRKKKIARVKKQLAKLEAMRFDA